MILKSFLSLSPHLDNNRLDAAHVRLPWCMLLHGLPGHLHSHQDARVGRNNYAAWEDVAENKERHSVRAGRAELIGQTPVDAAGGSIRLWSVLSPVDQWRAGKQQRIDPGTGYEQLAVKRLEPVSCQNRQGFQFIANYFKTSI